MDNVQAFESDGELACQTKAQPQSCQYFIVEAGLFS